jgi:hypothetical protein
VVVAAIVTVTAAAMTAMCQRNGDATATVMEVYCQGKAGCGLSPEQISAISALMAKQSKAKAATNYAHANKIFDLLLREYDINIDNRAGAMGPGPRGVCFQS